MSNNNTASHKIMCEDGTYRSGHCIVRDVPVDEYGATLVEIVDWHSSYTQLYSYQFPPTTPEEDAAWEKAMRDIERMRTENDEAAQPAAEMQLDTHPIVAPTDIEPAVGTEPIQLTDIVLDLQRQIRELTTQVSALSRG